MSAQSKNMDAGMDAKHTATPWTTRKDGMPELRNQNNLIEGASCELVAYAQLTDADAAFIVRACNTHDELVKSLEWIATRYDDSKSTNQVAMDAYDMACVARAALAALSRAGAA